MIIKTAIFCCPEIGIKSSKQVNKAHVYGLTKYGFMNDKL